MRSKLTCSSQALELGQLSLHLKQSQVCFFELRFAVGDLSSRLVHPIFQLTLLKVKLLGHLSYPTKHPIEARCQQTDLISHGWRRFCRKIAFFGLRHREQQAVDRLVDQVPEK